MSTSELNRSISVSTNSKTPTRTPTPEKGSLSGRKISDSTTEGTPNKNSYKNKMNIRPVITHSNSNSVSLVGKVSDESPSLKEPVSSILEEDEPVSASTSREVKTSDHNRISSAMGSLTLLDLGSSSISQHRSQPSVSKQATQPSVSKHIAHRSISRSKKDKVTITTNTLTMISQYEAWIRKFNENIRNLIHIDIKKGKNSHLSSKKIAEQILKNYGMQLTNLLKDARNKRIKVYDVVRKLIEVISSDLEKAQYSKNSVTNEKAASIASFLIKEIDLYEDEDEIPEYKIYLQACAFRWSKEPKTATPLLATIEDFSDKIVVAIDTLERDIKHSGKESSNEYIFAIETLQEQIMEYLNAFGYSAPDQSNQTEAAEILHEILLKVLSQKKGLSDPEKYEKLQFFNMFFRGVDYTIFSNYLRNNIKLCGEKKTPDVFEQEMIKKGKISKELLGKKLENEILMLRRRFPNFEEADLVTLQMLLQPIEKLYANFIDSRFDGNESAKEQFPEYLNYRLIYLKNLEHILRQNSNKVPILKNIVKFHKTKASFFKLEKLKLQYHYYPSKIIEDFICDPTIQEKSATFSHKIPNLKDLNITYFGLFLMRKLELFQKNLQTIEAVEEKHKRLQKIVTQVLSIIKSLDIDNAQLIIKTLKNQKLLIQDLISHDKTFSLVGEMRANLAKIKTVILANSNDEPAIVALIDRTIKGFKGKLIENPYINDQIDNYLEMIYSLISTIVDLTKSFLAKDSDLEAKKRKLIADTLQGLNVSKLADEIKALEAELEAIKKKGLLLGKIENMLAQIDLVLEQHEYFYPTKGTASSEILQEREQLPLENKLLDILLKDIIVPIDKKRTDEWKQNGRLKFETELQMEKELLKNQAAIEKELEETFHAWLRACK